jgi:membrane protease YdiL (CAAX protease family)
MPSLRRVFIGSRGLRAGWSAALFLALFAGMGFALAKATHFAGFGASPAGVALSPRAGMHVEGLLLTDLFAATWIMAKIERRSVWSYGLLGPRRLARFLGGIAVGVAAISAIVGILAARGLLTFDGRLLHGAQVWEYALLWGLFFVAVALFEEGFFRGYLLQTLARGMSFFWAAVVLSIAFGAVHGINAGESPAGLFGVVAIGLLFCASLYLTGSLWWAIGAHAAWDWAQSFLYGVPDSGYLMQGHLYATRTSGNVLLTGGSAGPEGSLYTLPVLFLIAIGMRVVWGRERPSRVTA